MSHTISINKEDFTVKVNEYKKVDHKEFTNLHILDSLGEHEYVISLLHQLSLCCSNVKPNLIISEITHGGYIPIKVSSYFNVIEGIVASNDDFLNMEINRKKAGVYNITVFDKTVWEMIIREDNIPYIAFIKASRNRLELGENTPIFILTDDTSLKPHMTIYTEFQLSFSPYRLFVHTSKIDEFQTHFAGYFENGVLTYDNLIHLTMIIKNGGDSLADVLRENMRSFDEYTILDTGSTDNTVEILKEVLKNKKGRVYEEPFINFRDSRNRCLDLAGDSCKFTIMLDDTYIIKENLRRFLQTVRGDQFADSFSLYIKSDDVEYGSNRIIKTATHLRYIYKIHEVITPKNNNNVIVPKECAHIFDYRSDYMEDRTMTRKQYDLKILYEMIDDDPNDSRAYYYLGQTYNLLKEHEKAFENFIKRIEHHDEGFIQEKIDACFEAARLSNFSLNKPWSETEALYKRAFEMDKSRPDSLYFLGIHFYLEQEYSTAYDYFKLAYTLGYPVHCQYSLKPTLSFYFLPKFLAEVCYYMKDFELGLHVSDFFLTHNSEDTTDKVVHYTMTRWKKIYHELTIYTRLPKDQLIIVEKDRPKIVFIVNGGFTTWTGSDILKRGIGGSETFIIEISKYVQRDSNFHCVVFCNCENEEIYEGVEYKPLAGYANYLVTHEIHSVVISRYPEYLPVVYQCQHIGNVYLILHDLIPGGEIVMRDSRLRKVLLLSNYHKQFFDNMFPTLADITMVFGYGIDQEAFLQPTAVSEKIPYKFIYSSFANRGLLYLLQMWRRIRERFPTATLHIHCDVENQWLNAIETSHMQAIKTMLIDLKNDGIFYRGWTNKSELYATWKTADVWFYPTTFLETFCLTALECALSKTLAVTFPIGSLLETVGDRGVLINQNLTLQEGQDETLRQLFWILDDENKRVKEDYITRNYEWVIEKSWKLRGSDFAKLMTQESQITPTPKRKGPFLPSIIQYYTSFMKKKISNVMLFGKCETLDDSIFTNSIIYRETREEAIVSYLKKKVAFIFIYLDDVKDSMIINLCFDVLLESGGILRLDSKSYDIFTSQFSNFVLLESDDTEFYIEKNSQ
jgi:tetratricopeptide (TPR) repeat protein